MQPQQPANPAQDNNSANNPLNYAFLQRVGLGSLSQTDQDALLYNLRIALEMRVGEKLHAQLNEQQLQDFAQFMPKDDGSPPPDPTAAKDWLERNAPNFRDVVANELALLEKEVAEQAPQILAEINASAQQPPVQQPQQPPVAGPQPQAYDPNAQQQPPVGPNYPQQPAA